MCRISFHDAVVTLSLTLVNTGLVDVTDSSGLNNVADDKLLDGLVLGTAAGAVGAPDGVHVAAAVLVASSIAALGRLKTQKGGVTVITTYLTTLSSLTATGYEIHIFICYQSTALGSCVKKYRPVFFTQRSNLKTRTIFI